MTLLSCYFPTTVLLIDDDRKYLNKLKLELDIERAVYQLYSSPQDALQFLTHDYHPDPFSKRCVLHPEETLSDYRDIAVNVRAIREETFNPHRFEQISVLVVDYAMPGMTGVELCQQLKDNTIKKLMLTGEADEKIATEAFNSGIIDKFIRKDDPQFSTSLNAAIAELQQDYFQALSAIIINSLTQNPQHHPFSCLDDPVFIQLFNKLHVKHHFSEYYLTDAEGSFMFLNFEGKPSWLIVKEEDSMQGAYETALYADVTPDIDTLKALEQRQLMAYFHSDADVALLPGQWQQAGMLHPAKKLSGRQTYYYAYINDPKAYDTQADKVLSYKAYLDQLHGMHH